MGSIQSNHFFIPFIITVKNTTQENEKKKMCSENGLAAWIHRISLAHFHFVLLVLQAVNGQHGVHCGWCCSPCDKRVLGMNLQASWGFSLWSLHCFHCACFSVFLVLGFFQETKVMCVRFIGDSKMSPPQL